MVDELDFDERHDDARRDLDRRLRRRMLADRRAIGHALRLSWDDAR